MTKYTEKKRDDYKEVEEAKKNIIKALEADNIKVIIFSASIQEGDEQNTGIISFGEKARLLTTLNAIVSETIKKTLAGNKSLQQMAVMTFISQLMDSLEKD